MIIIICTKFEHTKCKQHQKKFYVLLPISLCLSSFLIIFLSFFLFFFLLFFPHPYQLLMLLIFVLAKHTMEKPVPMQQTIKVCSYTLPHFIYIHYLVSQLLTNKLQLAIVCHLYKRTQGNRGSGDGGGGGNNVNQVIITIKLSTCLTERDFHTHQFNSIVLVLMGFI